MIIRIDDFYTYFDISEKSRIFCRLRSGRASIRSRGMLALQDFEALSAILTRFKPLKIMEIGTYLGNTSEFFLNFLTETKVISIAYPNPDSNKRGPYYNNSELDMNSIGSEISDSNKTRFKQLYGDSHNIEPDKFKKEYGCFDLVFIDGDHSYKGIVKDTELARNIISENGVICWHDANPRKEYIDVRNYLENELELELIATKDNYIGGIAAWNKNISSKINS